MALLYTRVAADSSHMCHIVQTCTSSKKSDLFCLTFAAVRHSGCHCLVLGNTRHSKMHSWSWTRACSVKLTHKHLPLQLYWTELWRVTIAGLGLALAWLLFKPQGVPTMKLPVQRG